MEVRSLRRPQTKYDMTTKEFIQLLEEEDPSGETHVRIGGAIESVEINHDGVFSFLDKEGNMHFTSNGYRVTMKVKGKEDFVSKDLADWYALQGRNNPRADRQMLLEKLQTFFVVEAQGHAQTSHQERVVKMLDEWIEKQEKK